MSIIDIASTKITNTIARNVTKKYHSKTIRYKFDSYILHGALLAIMLPLIITIICYYHEKNRSK